ncbi:MAG TPA: hypothetical protein VNX26_04490 [Candidatus Acidoferrum sp.]|jgi:hypothetical protein|nr:hypothetical protein [Candidatus Acidoferrum sp.]
MNGQIKELGKGTTLEAADKLTMSDADFDAIQMRAATWKSGAFSAA